MRYIKLGTTGLDVSPIAIGAMTYGDPGRGPKLEEGMVLAVEPMVNAGRHTVRMGDDGWSIFSQDGSLAAHFEFTIAVTAEGPRVLTPWHEAGGGRAAAA